MDHEAEVGLVVAHAQRRGRDQRLEPVVAQVVLEPLPGGGVQPAGVGRDREPVAVDRPHRLGEALGVGHGQRVDDAGPGQLGQVVDHPGVALQRREVAHHRELQAGPGQGAAQHQGRLAELGGDVVGDPLVGGRRGRQHRGGGVEPPQDVGHAAVVGAEVVAPVGDRVGLVDDHQPEPPGQRVEHAPPEARVGQPLRRHEQDVEPAPEEVGLHLGPRLDVAGVERRRPQPGLAGRRDLVTHQREQRRDHQGGAGPLGATHRGRRPVDRRLAPPRRLHDEHAGRLLGQGRDGDPLVVAQGRLRPGHRLDHPVGDRGTLRGPPRRRRSGRSGRSRQGCASRCPSRSTLGDAADSPAPPLPVIHPVALPGSIPGTRCPRSDPQALAGGSQAAHSARVAPRRARSPAAWMGLASVERGAATKEQRPAERVVAAGGRDRRGVARAAPGTNPPRPGRMTPCLPTA